ncbi:hypothetical protein ACFVUW_11740 [Streptomyces xiamenensis]|uniref:hypothetical protein n=1 Tax=Streptomyces xiamenensis TaxID=408015 RepID=UPI0036EE3464
MTSQALYGWGFSVASGHDYTGPFIRVPLPDANSGPVAIALEKRFEVFFSERAPATCQYDYSNGLIYTQTFFNDEERGPEAQIFEICVDAPENPRTARALEHHGTKFTAVSFGTDLSDNPVLYAADPSGSRLYQFGPPSGSGANKTRSNCSKSHYALSDPQCWAKCSIRDFTTRRIPAPGGGDVNMAYVLSGPDENNTYLLVTPLKQGENTPDPDYFDDYKTIHCDKSARQVTVDSQHKWAWVVGQDMMHRIDLQNPDQVNNYPGPWDSKVTFVQARGKEWGAIASGGGVKFFSVNSDESFWMTSPSDSLHLSRNPQKFLNNLDYMQWVGIVTSSDSRVWTHGLSPDMEKLFEWDTSCKDGTSHELKIQGCFPVLNDLTFARDGS